MIIRQKHQHRHPYFIFPVSPPNTLPSSVKPWIINCFAKMLNLLMVIGLYLNCGGDLIDLMIVSGGSAEVVCQN